MASMEITPPPEDLQKWYDELYADLPDLPDASEDSSRSKYDFRIAVRENNSFPITYLDQDESGTFDPACKKPPECVPISRKKREKRERIEYGTPKKLKTNTWQGGRWIGRQLPVVFTFASEMGRAALKDYGTSLDNWPERLPDPDSSDDSLTDWPDFSAQSYGLRERRRCDLSDPANAAGDDDLLLEDITLGYPAYRGCKGCFEWGFRCPLLDEGSRYPCAECAADNAECELIVDPAVKRTCEGCRSRRQQCSYREKGSDHTEPCQQCANASRKCVAGPAECSHCCNGGTTCTVASLDPEVTMSNKGKEKEHEIFSYKRSQPVTAEPTKSNRCRTITTNLAHPIQFNYAYDDDEKTAPCHWCEDAIYGILGLGKIEVEIIDNEDGQGFIETVGGHTGTYGHSRMCEFCTTDRLKITACQNHEIQLIEGMDPGKFDYKAVTEPPALIKTGNPAPKVDKMGDFMALNGHWDNQDDDEPGIFKQEELKD
ncbi:MAG: hypothetical protein ASARMPREDX12_005059 [Alectoria sarmentosa]|nr:MAG: hypothetical protein ASARMPREDX12_005059 [Alectoria sarmentosa]